MDNSEINHQSASVEIEMQDIRTRPASFYENTKRPENQRLTSSNNNVNKEECPNMSQINFVHTTVPVNILNQDIGGKHTPTRNSLRHSRMIVLNKTGEAPLVLANALHHHQLVKFLLIGILVIGLALCILSLWLLLWTPNLRTRDNPGWSGIPILVSSFSGILFISSIPNPKGYSGRKFGYWQKTLKYTSVIISMIAAVTALLTLVYSLLHIIALMSMTCAPPAKLVSTCLCSLTSAEEPNSSNSYHYVDLSCGEVENILTIFIIFSCVVSSIVFLFELIYLYLHWVNRNIDTYVRVPINVTALDIHRENR